VSCDPAFPPLYPASVLSSCTTQNGEGLRMRDDPEARRPCLSTVACYAFGERGLAGQKFILARCPIEGRGHLFFGESIKGKPDVCRKAIDSQPADRQDRRL